MLLYALPFVMFFFVLTIVLTERLSSPLRKLAMFSANLKGNERTGESADIPTWYFEAKQLNETIHDYAKSQQQRVEDYKERSYTDPLTGLKNRRYGDKVTAKWTMDNRPFSMIMIDIDHFKAVNDRYGHQIGDEADQRIVAIAVGVFEDQEARCEEVQADQVEVTQSRRSG